MSADRTRRLKAAVAIAGASVLLAGCGQIHPGQAATVGDSTISRGSLDTIVAAQCQLAAAAGAQAQQVSRAQVARQILSALVESRVQLDYAADVDLSYDDTKLKQYLAGLPDQLSALGPTRRDAFVSANEQVLRGQLVVQEVGRKALLAEGTKAPTSDQALKAGATVVQKWALDKGPSISSDPRYGLTFKGLLSSARDGSVSRPVSTFAKQSVSNQPDAEFVSGLPRAQSC